MTNPADEQGLAAAHRILGAAIKGFEPEISIFALATIAGEMLWAYWGGSNQATQAFFDKVKSTRDGTEAFFQAIKAGKLKPGDN